MRVTINGEPHEVTEGLTVAELINELHLPQRRIAVEVNREILACEECAARMLRSDDEIEIVHFVGGG